MLGRNLTHEDHVILDHMQVSAAKTSVGELDHRAVIEQVDALSLSRDNVA